MPSALSLTLHPISPRTTRTSFHHFLYMYRIIRRLSWVCVCTCVRRFFVALRMVLLGFIWAIWSGLQVTFLALRGQVNPATSIFFVPDSDGWVYYPAVMDDPSMDLRPSLTRRNIRFFLWTRQNAHVARELFVDEPRLLQLSTYSPARYTKILFHGFTNDVVSEFVIQTRNAYLSVGDYNVIGVDWSELARAPFYNSAATNTRDVGKAAAGLVDFLVNEGTPINYIHLLGFSLGAHAAGWAGASLKVGTLPRITAFDPAYPGFDGPNARRRLTKSDAKFVDVIHTNARTGLSNAVGIEAPLGHADFYPNGGSRMPGCIGFSFQTNKCSHVRSRQYFVESIVQPYAFAAVPCSSYKEFVKGNCGNCSTNSTTKCVYMGEYLTTSASGLYYLRTRSFRPYSLD